MADQRDGNVSPISLISPKRRMDSLDMYLECSLLGLVNMKTDILEDEFPPRLGRGFREQATSLLMIMAFLLFVLLIVGLYMFYKKKIAEDDDEEELIVHF